MLPCQLDEEHIHADCPFAHPLEKACRRDVRIVNYIDSACPDFRKVRPYHTMPFQIHLEEGMKSLSFENVYSGCDCSLLQKTCLSRQRCHGTPS